MCISTIIDPPLVLPRPILFRLKKGLDNRVSAQFATMQMAAVDAGESKVFATLGAATNLLVDLETVDTEVQSVVFSSPWCGALLDDDNRT